MAHRLRIRLSGIQLSGVDQGAIRDDRPESEDGLVVHTLTSAHWSWSSTPLTYPNRNPHSAENVILCSDDELPGVKNGVPLLKRLPPRLRKLRPLAQKMTPPAQDTESTVRRWQSYFRRYVPSYKKKQQQTKWPLNARRWNKDCVCA